MVTGKTFWILYMIITGAILTAIGLILYLHSFDIGSLGTVLMGIAFVVFALIITGRVE